MKKLLLFATILFAFYATTSAQIGGYAIKFDGVDDYISTDFTTDLATWTIECWVKGDAAPGNTKTTGVIHRDGNFNISWDHTESGKQGTAQLLVGGIWYTASFGTLAQGQWYHLAATYTNGTLNAYTNGVLISSNSTMTGNPSTEDNSLTIGKHSDPETINRCFGGVIDEVRIWNVVRTPEQIRANMFRELAGNEDFLQVYYKMSDGSGTTVTDNKTSGTTINGTLVNHAFWRASGCFAGPLRTLVNGNSKIVETPSSLSSALSGQSKFTFMGWVRPSSLNAWQTIFCRTTGFHQYRTIVQTSGDVLGNSKIYVSISNGVINGGYTEADVLQPGVWTHVAVVFDGTFTGNSERLKVYIDGVQKPLNFSWQENREVPTTTHTGTQTGSIGGEFLSTNNFNGSYDEISVWNAALTPALIRDIMMRSLSGNEVDLQAYYRFDESAGTTAYDFSSNARHATLQGMTFDANSTSSTAFNTWIGSESSSWATGANWGLGTPTNGDMNAGVYKWALGNELNINTAALEGLSGVKHFLISAGSNPTLGASISVYGNLLVDANLDLNGKTITLVLGYNPYLFEGSGRVFGSTGSIGGPVYIPPASPLKDDKNLGFAITSPVELEVDVFRNHQVYTNSSGSSIARNFTVIAPTPPGSSDFPGSPATPAVIEFKYNELELNGIPEADLLLVKTTNGTDWTSYPDAVVDQVNNKVTLTDNTGSLSIAGTWTLTNSNNPLPVELTSFTAKATGNTVTLNWETKTEVMNLGFEVEMKTATTEWEKIGFVEGHHTSNSPKYYSFTDQPKASGKILYRLKQLDTDGQFEYSSEVSVDLGLPTEFSLSQNYPNPFNPETVIGYALPVTGEVNISIYNAIGEKIATLVDGMKEAGNHQVSFNADNLPSGLYFCRMIADKFTTTRKMMLMR